MIEQHLQRLHPGTECDHKAADSACTCQYAHAHGLRGWDQPYNDAGSHIQEGCKEQSHLKRTLAANYIKKEQTKQWKTFLQSGP